MFGQGSPHFESSQLLRSAQRWFWPCALLFALIIGNASQILANELDLRLRIAWGGGEACSWQGSIELSEGTLSDVQPLGLEADSPGALQMVSAQSLRVFPRMPRTYDGCDLHVVAPGTAVLRVNLFPAGGAAGEVIELPLDKLKQGFHSLNLDEHRNRLLVQRSPGDTLRVNIEREHLIYSPGEKFSCEVLPNAFPLTPNTAYILSAALVEARGGRERNRLDLEIKSDDQGAASAVAATEFALPLDEGVYDVVFSLYVKRLTTPLLRGKPVLERRVQLVVVDPVLRPPLGTSEWKTTWEIDPANPKWWERMTRIPTLPKLPGLTTQALTNGESQTHSHLGRTWVQLPANVWQAYPLSVEEIGRPHVLQVEYPSDLPQSLGISIVEPNAAGQVVPIGLDTGVDVSPPAAGVEAKVTRHRVIFWPQTKAPVVLLTNRRPGQAAWFGKISLQAGPITLPPIRLPATKVAQRMLATCLERPLIAENFSAGEALDPTTGRTLDDWVTFYLATTRLVEYLQHTGSGVIMLPVVCEGSSLYPSQLLEPTPRYDTGLFFESGQDPLRKDVLELLLRLCDRSGVQCVPTLQFNTPIPELERQRLLDPANATGIEPLGIDGRPILARRPPRRGLAPYYNPLDARVQQAMQRVVHELTARYAEHPSLTGIGLQLGPESFALLPDDQSGCDMRTLLAFQKQTGVSLSDLQPQQPNWRIEALQSIRTNARTAWLNWRSQQIAGFYRNLQRTVEQNHPGGKLFVLPGELLAARPIQFALRPTLPAQDQAAAAFAAFGFDPRQFAADQSIILPFPQRIAPEFIGLSTAYHAWGNGTDLPALFTGAAYSTQVSFEPAPLALPSFDQVSPFGAEQTRLWLVPQFARSEALHRERFVHSISTSDTRLLIEGGWMTPLGQEDALTSLLKVYRRLPDEPFQTAQPKNGIGSQQPVVLRTLVRRGKTYFYCTNDSPWPVTVEIDWQAAGKVTIEPYSSLRDASSTTNGTRTTWTVKLEPYDLMGGEIANANTTVETWRTTLPTAAADDLREQVRQLRFRANALRSPRAKEVLSNPSFEKMTDAGAPTGWVHAQGPHVNAEIDIDQPHDGKQSLHLESTRDPLGRPAPAWVRSDPIPVPTTGRLSVVAHLRIADPARQPRLRLAIEGKLDGQPYYRWSNVGIGEDGKPLKVQLQNQWNSYRFPLTDLPLSGLTDLRIGFDLMDEGEVWIDDIQVYDLWFDDHERDELLKGIASADFELTSGQLVPCQRFLESYWPLYLRNHVAGQATTVSAAAPPKVIAANPVMKPASVAAEAINHAVKQVTPPAVGPAAKVDRSKRAERVERDPEEEPKPGMFERMRNNWWPSRAEKEKTTR
ncbi:hypothetical protein [Anatilimnocola floriformis]|uniref:hypothetical protein n=1 Tax=Anatilimnocola floriformis TaxID=2948575 RepID=UPI0020C3B724|nr:hypothetical protein [Anatilimnocola floriformis]